MEGKNQIINVIWGAILGSLISFVVILFILAYFNPHLYSVQIINDPKTFCTDIQLKELLITELRKDNAILTPCEYTNNIVSYYNTFITILIGLLALFSLFGYLHLKHTSKNEIAKSLKDMIRDSKEFEKTIKDYASGFIEDTEEFDTIRNNIKILEEKIENIRNTLEDLTSLKIDTKELQNGNKRKKTKNRK